MIWALPWGRVSLIDIYVGLSFFALWVAFREKSPWVVGGWWLGLLILGNLAAAVYLVVASFSSRTPHELMLGRREWA